VTGEEMSLAEVFPGIRVKKVMDFATNQLTNNTESGQSHDLLTRFMGGESKMTVCSECNGRGKRGLIAKFCSSCSGAGYLTSK